MNMPNFEFSNMQALLRCSVNDPKIQAFFGIDINAIERDEFYGSLEYKSEGVGVCFKCAEWLIPAAEITDPKIFHLCGFFLYSEGIEGFSRYSGQLPKGILWGDNEVNVISKLGKPDSRGGGHAGRLLTFIKPWVGYTFGDAKLHFQFDTNSLVELVTLFAPDIIIENQASVGWVERSGTHRFDKQM